MPRIAYRLIWIFSALAIIGFTFLFAGKPYAAPPTAKMKTFTIKDNSFSVMHPENWKSNSTASHDIESEVIYSPSPDIHFSVTSDLQGSLMASVGAAMPDLGSMGGDSSGVDAAALNGMPGMDKLRAESKKSPLEKLHEMQASSLSRSRRFTDFQDGKTKPYAISGSEALSTDIAFDMSVGFSGTQKMIGKRITVLTGERRVSVLYYCLKEKSLEITPIFEKMLKSLNLNPSDPNSKGV